MSPLFINKYSIYILPLYLSLQNGNARMFLKFRFGKNRYREFVRSVLWLWLDPENTDLFPMRMRSDCHFRFHNL